MAINNVLLSICIPTYNRADVLDDILEKITSQADFDEEVEIIISDNCSTDHTEMVAKKFCDKYWNVKYFRNKENVVDRNFSIALSHGKGEYLKLVNDYIYFVEGALSCMKKYIRQYREEKPLLFFTDKVKNRRGFIECKSLNEYVDTISHFVTWISCFGCWKEDWDRLEDKERYTSLSLSQVDWTFRMIAAKGECYIIDKPLMAVSALSLGKRSGYNFFNVHVRNYYSIMLPYVAEGLITQEQYKKDRKFTFRKYKKQIRRALFFKKDDFAFETKGTWRILWKYYKDVPLFYFYIPLYSVMSCFFHLYRWVVYPFR